MDIFTSKKDNIWKLKINIKNGLLKKAIIKEMIQLLGGIRKNLYEEKRFTLL
jgi:hypothetical protein